MTRSITLLAAAALLAAPEAFAQSGASSSTRSSEETIIIKKKGDDPQTTIEIADGTIKVNGETVAKYSDATGNAKRKKIIIDSHDDAVTEDFRRGFDDLDNGDDREERSVVRKTVLGVLTESTQALNGALVKRVIDGSAADAADLQAGDRIYKVDDKRIASSEDLVAIIGSHQPGDKVTIAYQRDGKNRTTSATLKAADPETTTLPNLPGGGRGWGDDMEDGMPNGMQVFPFGGDMGGLRERIEGMSRESQRPKLGVSVEDRTEGDGVRVADVTAGSAAEKAGLKADDILTHVDGEPLASVDDLQRSIRIAQPGDKLALRYERGGKQMKTDVTLPKVVRKRDL